MFITVARCAGKSGPWRQPAVHWAVVPTSCPTPGCPGAAGGVSRATAVHLQLAWVLSGISSYEGPGPAPSAVIPIIPPYFLVAGDNRGARRCWVPRSRSRGSGVGQKRVGYGDLSTFQRNVTRRDVSVSLLRGFGCVPQ